MTRQQLLMYMVARYFGYLPTVGYESLSECFTRERIDGRLYDLLWYNRPSCYSEGYTTGIIKREVR